MNRGIGAPARGNKTLIVIAAPSIHDPYYAKTFPGIIDFDIQFARTIAGNDDVVVLADRDTLPYLRPHLPKPLLLQSEMPDIWVRDFGTVLPSKMIKFRYRPSYLSLLSATRIENGFLGFAREWALEFQNSGLILDGGNFVDNGTDKAVLTERVFQDNWRLTHAEVIAEIKRQTGVTELAIIPETPGGTTGHSDGMAMWVAPDTLVVLKYDEPFRARVLEALRAGLPGVQIVEAPDGYIPGASEGFDSACGMNVNSLVTNDFIYMPVYGQPVDHEFIDIVKKHTIKTIKTVPAAGKVCKLGGSVRCLGWQLTGENARRVKEAAAK